EGLAVDVVDQRSLGHEVEVVALVVNVRGGSGVVTAQAHDGERVAGVGLWIARLEDNLRRSGDGHLAALPGAQDNSALAAREGGERAVLLDAGRALPDSGELARSVTDRPIAVVVSHHHFDHVGGNHLFEETAIHELGVALLAREMPPERPGSWLAYIERDLAG